MPPNSSLIDAALVALLGSDSTLLGLMPNGVYVDLAPPNSTRYVIVSVVDSDDVETFDGRAFESRVYLVKAVGQSKTGAPPPDMSGAAHRIDELLERGTLTVTGFAPMAMFRERYLRPPLEPDSIDPTIRWNHRGGHYRVVMST